MKRASFALFLIAMAGTLIVEAGNRRKLWELNLSKLVGEEQSAGFQPEPVWAMGFSLDETKLAIGFGERLDPTVSSSAKTKGHLIVISIDHPKTLVHRFEIDSSRLLMAENAIAWSSSGNSVAIRDSIPPILRLTGESPCGFPPDFQFGGFLSGDRAILYHRGESNWRNKPESREKTEIRVYRPDCSVADSWQLDDDAIVLDTCQASDLVALESFPGAFPHPPQSRIDAHIAILAYPSRDAGQRWTLDFRWLSGGERFARQCQVLCTGAEPAGRAAKSGEGDAACWDIQKGAKVSENTGVQLSNIVGPTGIAGSGGDLLLLNDYKITSLEGGLWQFFDLQTSWSHLKRRVLWNVSTGQEVVSWRPPTQQIEYHLLKEHVIKSLPFAASLSPTGKFLAEGGSGIVRLYSINQTGN